VDLVEVDVPDPEPVERGVEGARQVPPRQPDVVRSVAGREAPLGREHDLVGDVGGDGRPPATDDPLRLGPGVHVGDVDEVPAGLDEPVELLANAPASSVSCPKVIVPRQSDETTQPLRPSNRCSTIHLLGGTGRGHMPDTMKRRPNGLPALATKALESIGLLNKGSAALSQAPSSPSEPGAAAPETGEPPPVVDPALNVTRVGGTTALITGAGGAFLTLTNLTDQTPDAVRVAAYAGTAVVVAAALIATAIMIVADIRARSALAVARLTAPAAPTSGTTSDDPPPSFRAAWAQVLRLQNVKDQTRAVGRPDLTRLCRKGARRWSLTSTSSCARPGRGLRTAVIGRRRRTGLADLVRDRGAAAALPTGPRPPAPRPPAPRPAGSAVVDTWASATGWRSGAGRRAATRPSRTRWIVPCGRCCRWRCSSSPTPSSSGSSTGSTWSSSAASSCSRTCTAARSGG
jgi:hypothetical protein